MCDHALEGEWPATAVGLDKVCCFASGDRVLVASGIHDSFTAPFRLIPNPPGIW